MLTRTNKATGEVTSYVYNAADQLTSSSTYNPANQQTSQLANYTYNSSGATTNDGEYIYQYDASDRLIKVLNSADLSFVASYTYDATGRRTSKTTPSGTTYYYYNDITAFLSSEQRNGSKLSFIGDTDEYGRLIGLLIDGAQYFYVYNGNGEIIGLTDTSGAFAVCYSYDSWGNPKEYNPLGNVVPLGTFANPYIYKTYYLDTETNLYYLNARYYDSSIGRFLTRDPDSGDDTDRLSKNEYAYGYNNPVNNEDPDGHGFFSWIKNTYHKARRFVKRTYHRAKRFVKRVVKRVVRTAKKVYGSVKRTYNRAKTWVRKSYSKAKTWVKNTAKKVVRTVKRIARAVKKVAKKVVNKAKAIGKKIVAGAKALGKAVGGAIAKGATTVGNIAVGAMDVLLGGGTAYGEEKTNTKESKTAPSKKKSDNQENRGDFTTKAWNMAGFVSTVLAEKAAKNSLAISQWGGLGLMATSLFAETVSVGALTLPAGGAFAHGAAIDFAASPAFDHVERNFLKNAGYSKKSTNTIMNVKSFFSIPTPYDIIKSTGVDVDSVD